MQKEAEQFAEDDKKKKESAELKNEAEALVYTIDKTIKDVGEKLDKTQIADLEKDKNELKDLIKSDDTSNLKKKLDDINKKIHEMSTKMYQEAMKQETEAKDHEVKNDKSGKRKDEKAVDAEIVDEKEDK